MLLSIDLSGMNAINIEARASFNGGDMTIDMPVVNHGTITGGTFTKDVSNDLGGTISGGVFNATVSNTVPSRITGGTFNGLMNNISEISGGTFNGSLLNQGEVQGLEGSVPTINCAITQAGDGYIRQPCAYGENAEVNANDDNGDIQVGMTVEGYEGDFTPNYGDNVLSALNGVKKGLWVRLDENGEEISLTASDTFGLQRQTYVLASVYRISGEDALEGIDLAPYEYILVEEGGTLCADDALSVTIPVTNYGTIFGGAFAQGVTNHGTISGGAFAQGATNYGAITGGSFPGVVSNESGAAIEGACSPARWKTGRARPSKLETLPARP